MPICPSLVSFSTGGIVEASEHNSNYTNLRDTLNTYAVLTDVARTITVTHTFSASQTFSTGFTSGAGITVTAGGYTVTGNSTITGTLVVSAGISVTTGGLGVGAGGITVTGNSTITGTLGSLTGLTVASGTTAVQALTCTTFTPSGLAQAGQQAAYLRYSAGDSGAAPAINWNNGNWQRWRLTANATPTFSNPVKGAQYLLELQQDGTGSRTVTWSGATVVWADGVAPTLTATANRKTLISLLCVDATSAGTYLANVAGYNYDNTTA